MSNDLTFPERNDYTKRLARLKRWKNDTLQFSIDLAYVRDNKLYREDYDTFDEFLKAELGLGKSQAYRMIDFAKQKQLGSDVETERENRAKNNQVGDKKYDPVFGSEVPNGDEVGDKNKPPKKQPPKPREKVVDLDKEGHAIPEEILERWNEADEEFRELVSVVGKVKLRIQKAKKDDSIIYRNLPPSALAYAENLYSVLKDEIPYSVCTECQGFECKTCTACKTRGFFGKHIYDNAVPVETKELRKRVLTKAKK